MLEASTAQSLIATILAEEQAEDIVSIDLRGRTNIADFMVIASGRSARHTNAMADKLYQRLKAQGSHHLHTEGLGASEWVVIDAGDVIVHLFYNDQRSVYALEKLWSDDLEDEPSGELAEESKMDGSEVNESKGSPLACP